MSDTLLMSPTLSLPKPLWDKVEKTAKAQQSNANHVVKEALEYYLSTQPPETSLTPEEPKAQALKRLYERVARHRREFARLVAEGKVYPLPKDIPLEQVRKGLSGIKGSLSAEIIKEREEGGNMTFYFFDYQNKYLVIDMEEAIRVSAGKLILRQNLRSADSIQLATALDDERLPPIFVCSDEKLCNAASNEGLQVLNPEK